MHSCVHAHEFMHEKVAAVMCGGAILFEVTLQMKLCREEGCGVDDITQLQRYGVFSEPITHVCPYKCRLNV